jgi:hypothetical protein
MTTEIISPEHARTEQAKRASMNTETEEEHIAQSIIPYNRDDPKARYLGLRSSGFTTREALKLIGYGKSALSMWRVHDEEFAKLEADLPKYRKQLANEYVHLEFIRNYRLVLEKDYRVLQDSLNPRTEVVKEVTPNEIISRVVTIPMDKQDHDYLIKARGHYTPQQLQIIETLMSGKESGADFDFTDFILAAAKTKQMVTTESKKITFEVSHSESVEK